MTDERTIENLMSSYAFLVDDGDFEGLGQLLEHCDFTLGAGPAVRGGAAVVVLARGALQLHSDGTPRTRHVTGNLLIEVDTDAGNATARAYYTVFQAADGFPLQPIACGGYLDRFERHEGTWRFAARSVQTGLVGDTSQHRRGRPLLTLAKPPFGGRHSSVAATFPVMESFHTGARRHADATGDPTELVATTKVNPYESRG